MSKRKRDDRPSGGPGSRSPLLAGVHAPAVAEQRVEVHPQELVGSIVDVTYDKPPNAGTYRLRVTRYDPKTGLHHVDSRGFSSWAGADFRDTIHAAGLANSGRLKIVSMGICAAPVGESQVAPVSGDRRRVASDGRGRGRGRGPSRGAGESAAPATGSAASSSAFGNELLGEILDITYPGEGCYRVRVVGFMPEQRWHRVSSAGLSSWDGEDFEDEVNLGEMQRAGLVTFVSRAAAAARVGGPKRRATASAASAASAVAAASAASAPSTPAAAAPAAPVAVPREATAASSSASSGKAARRRAADPPGPPGPVRLVGPFGQEIIGCVVDVAYAHPRATYRMQVVDFDSRRGFHEVVSHGDKGLWDGSTFEDTINLNAMSEDGCILFHTLPAGAVPPKAVEVPAVAAPAAAAPAAPMPRPRLRRRRQDLRRRRTAAARAAEVPAPRAAERPAPSAARAVRVVAAESVPVENFGRNAHARPAPQAAAPLSIPLAGVAAIAAAAATAGGLRQPYTAARGVARVRDKAKAQRVAVPLSSMPPPPAPPRSRPPPSPAPMTEELEPPELGAGMVFGGEHCGLLVDLTYTKPRRRTVRVRVMRYLEDRGLHVVSSSALPGSKTPNTTVLDEVDLNALYAAGMLRIVSPKIAWPGEPVEVGRGGRGAAQVSRMSVLVGAKKPPQASSGKSGGVLVSKKPRTMPPEDKKMALCGEVVDLHYPEGTFRTYVQSYSEATGWHNVTSKGFSTWDGEDFEDEVDLVQMLTDGSATLLSGAPRAEDDDERPVVAAASSVGKGRGKGAGRGRARSRDTRASIPPGKRRKAAAAVAAPETRAPSGYGPEMVNRVIDVAHTNEESAVFRVVVKDYDARTRKHHVESFPAGEEAVVSDWLDLTGLHTLGRMKIVDGLDDLQDSGHALVAEEINFLPREVAEGAAAEEGSEVWLKAKILGWWPQTLIPPVASGGLLDEEGRQAIFVAEEVTRCDRWSLTLHDAMLGATHPRKRGDEKRVQALFEVFAGSCELSLAFRRQGLDTEAYDIQLCSTQDFVKDEKFMSKMEQDPPWEIVHFAPPGSPAPGDDDAAAVHGRLVTKLADAVRRLYDLGRGVVLECDVGDSLWRTEAVQSLPDDLKPFEFDLGAFGGPDDMRVRLLTNRAAVLAPLVERAEQAAKARQTRRRSAAAKAALGFPGDRRYPRTFCEAYAMCFAKGEPTARSSHSASPAHEFDDAAAVYAGVTTDEPMLQEAAEPCPQQQEPEAMEMEMEEAAATVVEPAAGARGGRVAAKVVTAESSAAAGEVAASDGDARAIKESPVGEEQGPGVGAAVHPAQGEKVRQPKSSSSGAAVVPEDQDALESMIREEEGVPSSAGKGR